MTKNKDGYTIKHGYKLESYRTTNSKGNRTTRYRIVTKQGKTNIRTFSDRTAARKYMRIYGYQA